LDKAFLERCLDEGMSLIEIGKLVHRDPSTVGYWVKRHGLVANGSARYSSKGPIERSTLTPLLDRQLGVAEIATRLGASEGRVRYWLRKHGLEANGDRKRRLAKARAEGLRIALLECPRHGETEFWLGDAGRARCRRCNAERVSARRRRVKRILVAEAGGRCLLCGYRRSPVALEFHHLDPASKEFTIAARGATIAIDALREEASKCVLLCANCHAEVEAGIAEVPVR